MSDRERSFYEGRFTRSDLSTGSLRNWLVKKERFFIRRMGGRKGRVLDLGCGGGWAFLATVGPVVGLDLSLASAREARALYGDAVIAELSHLPFDDGAFDFVVSLDVLGHVPVAAKDSTLAEVHRVLGEGGETLHYVETEGDDPLMRFARRFPALYRKRVLEPEGHIGLESPAATLARFARPGWIALDRAACYRGLSYPRRLVQYFDNEYSRKAWWLAALVKLGKAATRFSIVEAVVNGATSVAMEVGDRVFPPSWAGGALVSFRKPRGHHGEEGV